jgi:uncharacterized OB-fold protein
MSGANTGGRPIVPPSALTEGFWNAAREHRLVLQRCTDCETFRHYPQVRCPRCLSERWGWVPVSGRGVVHTYSVSHRAFAPAWADRVPYAVATIELDEGPRVVSDLPPEDTDEVVIGRPVEAFFDDYEDVTLPRFRLVR